MLIEVNAMVDVTYGSIGDAFADLPSDKQAKVLETLATYLLKKCNNPHKFRVQCSLIDDNDMPNFRRMLEAFREEREGRCRSSNWQCVKAAGHDGLHAYEPKAQLQERR